MSKKYKIVNNKLREYRMDNYSSGLKFPSGYTGETYPESNLPSEYQSELYMELQDIESVFNVKITIIYDKNRNVVYVVSHHGKEFVCAINPLKTPKRNVKKIEYRLQGMAGIGEDVK